MLNTPDILKAILQRKLEEVAERQTKISLSEIKQIAQDCQPQRGFYRAITTTIEKGDAAIIAEIKKASPSKGIIRKDFSPTDIANAYAAAGATCLSVLTDVDFFMGDDAYLQEAKDACQLPILRKDFMIDPYQIYESKVIGADCVLLIVSALTDTQLKEFSDITLELGMDVLVEVHNREELERGLMLRTPLIGINNRDLHTFKASLETTISLLPDVFPDRTIITESGIHTREDIEKMRKNGVNAFLVGEALMAAPDPGKRLKELFN